MVSFTTGKRPFYFLFLPKKTGNSLLVLRNPALELSRTHEAPPDRSPHLTRQSLRDLDSGAVGAVAAPGGSAGIDGASTRRASTDRRAGHAHLSSSVGGGRAVERGQHRRPLQGLPQHRRVPPGARWAAPQWPTRGSSTSRSALSTAWMAGILPRPSRRSWTRPRTSRSPPCARCAGGTVGRSSSGRALSNDRRHAAALPSHSSSLRIPSHPMR